MTKLRTDPPTTRQSVNTPIVVVLGSNVSFAAEPGETVYAAAGRHGLQWPTVCGGRGICGVCVMAVVDEAENLSPVGIEERDLLARMYGTEEDYADFRLACRAKTHGDVTVQRRGVKPRSGGDGDES